MTRREPILGDSWPASMLTAVTEGNLKLMAYIGVITQDFPKASESMGGLCLIVTAASMDAGDERTWKYLPRVTIRHSPPMLGAKNKDIQKCQSAFTDWHFN